MNEQLADLASIARVLSLGVVSPAYVRPCGLTWQDPCSREAHQQIWLFYHPEALECPPGYFLNDPPSVSRPPS